MKKLKTILIIAVALLLVIFGAMVILLSMTKIENNVKSPVKAPKKTEANQDITTGEDNIRKTINEYTEAWADAVNNNDYKQIEKYIVPQSPFYESQNSTLNALNKKGIQEKFVSCKIESIEKKGDMYEVVVTEEYLITYSNSKQKNLINTWIYTVDPSSEWKIVKLSENAIKADSEDGFEAEKTYNMGMEAFGNGDYETSIKLFNRAIELSPNTSKYYEQLYTTMSISGEDYLGQLECINKLISLNPEKADYLISKASVLNDLGEYQKALDNFDIALDKGYGASGAINLIKVNALAGLGKYQDALDVCDWLISTAPNDAVFYGAKINLLEKINANKEDILACYKAWSENVSGSEFVYKNALEMYGQ